MTKEDPKGPPVILLLCVGETMVRPLHAGGQLWGRGRGCGEQGGGARASFYWLEFLPGMLTIETTDMWHFAVNNFSVTKFHIISVHVAISIYWAHTSVGWPAGSVGWSWLGSSINFGWNGSAFLHLQVRWTQLTWMDLTEATGFHETSSLLVQAFSSFMVMAEIHSSKHGRASRPRFVAGS